jgi:hypothetical protein
MSGLGFRSEIALNAEVDVSPLPANLSTQQRDFCVRLRGAEPVLTAYAHRLRVRASAQFVDAVRGQPARRVARDTNGDG